MRNQSTLQVDLSGVAQNCRAIRSHIGSQCKFCAVVKADGYGLGALRLGSTLADYADMLAVYSADEAGALLTAGIRKDILVLAPVYAVDRFHPLYRGMMGGTVHLVIHGEDQLRSVLQMASRFGSVIRVQVKVDTGLRRGGDRKDGGWGRKVGRGCRGSRKKKKIVCFQFVRDGVVRTCPRSESCCESLGLKSSH